MNRYMNQKKKQERKKKLCGILLVLSLAAGLASCGKKNTNTEKDSPKQQDEIQQDNQAQTEVYHASLPTSEEEADIFIEPIEDLSEDFIKGMDVSSVIAEEESGVVYYNEQGQQEDLFRVLADAGVNYIRVRIWNDPYDKNGNGYGGGNNDVEKAMKIGKRAAQNGMKLLADFHYSDLWADPAKQYAPKEWAHITLAQKEEALYNFTKESLQALIDAGADIGIVQIGNEINHGIAGEDEWERMTPLLMQASKAVREVASDQEQEMQIAVHFTNIEDHDQTVFYAQTLKDCNLDYDIFGVSYYPYWHGTMEHMTTVLKDIRNSFQKETIVLETSYCYTLEDGDGFDNSVSETDLVDGYTASVQSQATCVRDVMAAASKAKSLGVCYWEGAWIPVGPPENLADNQTLWEQYGSGWASSYAASYDKEDAGKYYGGCAWDNQAMFDHTGHPLASLNVFKYVDHGAACEPVVDYAEEVEVQVELGEPLKLPETVEVVYNDRTLNGPLAVTWDENDQKKVDTTKPGTYEVGGQLEDNTHVVCKVTAANKNWLKNPGFEQNDISMWRVSYQGDGNPTDIQEKESDAKSGSNSFHFWSEDVQDFKIEQTVTGLEAGSYTASVNLQGGDVGSEAKIYLYAVVNGKIIKSEEVKLSGWCEWQVPVIKGIKLDGQSEATIGVKVQCQAGGWGTMDDFSFVKQK